jgi:PIN domain nuclease of toxin-antitoxin system
MTRYLLDSHVWLWVVTRPAYMSKAANAAIAAPDAQVFISVATPWELLIKHEKSPIPGAVALLNKGSSGLRRALRPSKPRLLDIKLEDASLAPRLKLAQADPFDRMIVAQAVRRSLVVITSDSKMLSFPDLEFVAT